MFELMPKDECSRIPDSFLPRREMTRDLTPRDFLEYYYHLTRALRFLWQPLTSCSIG
jgi:hypothetical protein